MMFLMCDMGEAEWPEYLLQVEAVVARARVKVPRPAPARTVVNSEEPAIGAVEVSA